MWRALRTVRAVFSPRSIQTGLLGACFAYFAWGQSEAATFTLPANGVFEIGGYAAPTVGSFYVYWNNPYPDFDHADFANAVLSANVNGAAFTTVDALGKCPVSYCGPASVVTDNVYGTHLGPGGELTFSISNSILTISSSASISPYGAFFVNDGNPNPIGDPGNYNIIVDLPDGFYITPLPPALSLFVTALGGLGFVLLRGKRKVPPA